MVRAKIGDERVTVTIPSSLLESIDKSRGKVPRAVVIREALEQAFLPEGAQRIRASSGICAPLDEKAEAERLREAKSKAEAMSDTQARAITQAMAEHRHKRNKTLNGGGWLCLCHAQSWDNGRTWKEFA